MKFRVLCLILLSGCSWFLPSDPVPTEYELTWFCVSPDGCERTEAVEKIDRVTVTDYFYLEFTSTQDASFREDAQRITTDTLGVNCYWLQSLTLFGHELEPSKLCSYPGGFEMELSIPNPAPATHSEWVVAARSLALR